MTSGDRRAPSAGRDLDSPLSGYIAFARTPARKYSDATLTKLGAEDEVEFEEFLDALGIGDEAKNQILRDVRWLNRWGLFISRFVYAYSLVADFGVQLVGSIFLAIIIVGIFELPFLYLLSAAIVLLVLVAIVRFRFLVALIRRAQVLTGVVLSRDQMKAMRKEFRKAEFLRFFSLLVTLFFSTKIVGATSEIFGYDVIDVVWNFLTAAMGKMMAQLVIAGVAAILSFAATRKAKAIQPDARDPIRE